MTPAQQVLGRRLDALKDAIASRAPWHEIEFIYDQVRSSFDKMAGVRDRPYDSIGERQENLSTVAELRAFLADLPDGMPLGACYHVDDEDSTGGYFVEADEVASAAVTGRVGDPKSLLFYLKSFFEGADNL